MELRRLAYLDVGDPSGAPIVFCHGFPSSGRQAQLLHEPALGLGVRVIAPDRPGCGKSQFKPHRTLVDWAFDVAALADQLSLERFGLLGVSGGAPYALACAWSLAGRIDGCALVCPLGPLYLDPVRRAMSPVTRIKLGLALRAPVLFEILLGSGAAFLLSSLSPSPARLPRVNANKADSAVLADPVIEQTLGACIEDALADGARGALQDLELYLRDWGFPLENIPMTVDLWHGEADAVVPVSHTEWYAEHLPRTRIHCVPGEGHYSLPLRHAPEILRTLAAPRAREAAASQQGTPGGESRPEPSTGEVRIPASLR